MSRSTLFHLLSWNSLCSSLLDVVTAKMHTDVQVSKFVDCLYGISLCYLHSLLQTVPACQNLYRNSFIYHCLQDDKILQFDDAIQFLGALTLVLQLSLSSKAWVWYLFSCAWLWYYLFHALDSFYLCKVHQVGLSRSE